VIRHGAAIQTAGVTLLGRLLTTGQAGELQHYFGAKPVYDPYRSEASRFLPDSDERHPESHVAYHDARDVVSAPYLLDIANRPDILEIVSDFLGCQPTLSYLAAWWSYQTHVGPQQAECFHRDVDDWRFLKLFVYLTDVEPDNGPHVYVRHSSRSSRLREIRRFADSEVVEAFGGESVLRVTGQAGEGFLEDTFGIHKGQPVARGKRLIFQAVYSMFPLPYGPSVPIANLHQVSLSGERRPDRWINRLYLRS
jgi:hypothetical protein